MINLNDHRSNIYTPGGEDGMIAYLYDKVIDPIGGVCEFGAADGLFFSNTAQFWRDRECTDAILIESDEEKYGLLVENTKGYDRVTTRNEQVVNIDEYVPESIDIMSIDVDGSDYHIVAAMKIRHQIVVVEYNPTVPPHLRMVGTPGTLQGSSALSITEMMGGKGYTLVGCTKTNLMFLYGDWHEEFVTDLDVLFDRSSLNYVITSHDGDYTMVGEFGYGLERKFRLPVYADGYECKFWDAVMIERLRQLKVGWITDEEFAKECVREARWLR